MALGTLILNNSGVVSSGADTDTPDPNAPNLCFADCFVVHDDGVLTNLGALPGINSSAAGAINARGWSVGQSQNGLIDPLNGFPEIRAVLWTDDHIHNLGVQDPNGQFPHHAFLWRDGNMRNLGTLAFTSHAESINNKGQVVGRSRIECETCDLQHAFLWEHGGPMIDLNTLVTLPAGLQLIDAVNINERGEILVVELPPGVQLGQGMRLALLVPCAGDEEGCNENAEAGTAATQKNVLIISPATSGQSRPTTNGMAGWRERLARRYHMPVGAPRD